MKSDLLIISSNKGDTETITKAMTLRHVTSVDRISQAIEMFNKRALPHVILLDLDDDEEQWKLFITQVKSSEHSRYSRIIVLSREQHIKKEEIAFTLGADDFLRRPLTHASISKVLALHSDLLRAQELEAEILDTETVLHTLFEQSPMGAVLIFSKQDEDGDVTRKVLSNSAFQKLFGYTSEEIQHKVLSDFTYAEQPHDEFPLHHALITKEIDHYSLEKKLKRKDGTPFWAMVNAARIHIGTLFENNYLFLLQDISKRKKLEQELFETEQSQRTLLSNIPGMVYRSKNDDYLTLEYISDGCYELTGYRPEQLLQSPSTDYYEIVAPEYRDIIVATIQKQLLTQDQVRIEYEIITADQKRKWVLELAKMTKRVGADEDVLEGFVLDIDKEKRVELQLAHQHRHNHLTGLPNRQALEERLESDSKKLLKGKRALLSINFTPLYMMSLRFGHNYVQEIIKRVATTLATFVNHSIEVYGVFDNRFIIYVTSYKEKSSLTHLALQVKEQVNKLLSLERISWGIGIFELDWSTPSDYKDGLKYALVASENAINVHSRTSSITFYDKTMSDNINKESTILFELDQVLSGVDTDRIYLNYQPIVDIRSNTIVGFEALARFTSHTYGAVSPLLFIPIAEKYELITPLGNLIIEQAIECYKNIRKHGYTDVGISINISPYQLLKEEFVPNIKKVFTQHGAKASHFTLEITETGVNSTYMQLNQSLQELQDFGFNIAIDDFGIGYSSFARESELSVDFLKIDKIFVDKLITQGSEKALISDIISMAHKLGHQVIVEGVEHHEQRELLQTMNCDMYQGFVFSKPVDQQHIFSLLEKHYKKR
ncbi:MAG: EAL domain-containing protein [Sphaerochaetaceae bacterium]|jgi:PAS domain S-box-containing protein